jgi:hypothetical protein
LCPVRACVIVWQARESVFDKAHPRNWFPPK